MLVLLAQIPVVIICRVITGAVLIVAACSKLITFGWFTRVLASYELLPRTFAGVTAALAILAELGVGVLVLAGRMMPWSAFAAAGLLGCFTAAVAINLARGKFTVECGCLGPWRKSRIGWLLLFRNSGLIGLALLSVPWKIEHRTLPTFVLFVSSLILLGIALIPQPAGCVHGTSGSEPVPAR